MSCSDNGVTNPTELRTEEYGGASFLMNSKFCGEEPDDIDGATTTPTKIELNSHQHHHKAPLNKQLKSELLLGNLGD